MDGYAATALDNTLNVLSQRYGFDRVRSTAGNIFIDIPLKLGGMFIAVLTWEQAKYLATNPLAANDLKPGKKLPAHWPKP